MLSTLRNLGLVYVSYTNQTSKELDYYIAGGM